MEETETWEGRGAVWTTTIRKEEVCVVGSPRKTKAASKRSASAHFIRHPTIQKENKILVMTSLSKRVTRKNAH